MSNTEINQYRIFTTPAELHKAVNTFNGILAGIEADKIINAYEVEELSNWCLVHQHLRNRNPFDEILPIAEKTFKSHKLDTETKDDLLWLCNNFLCLDKNKYYDEVTSSIQYLAGLIHGVMADGKLTDEEILTLNEWLKKHDFLYSTYPFDEIYSLIQSVLLDNFISEDERNMLKAFFSNFIDLSTSYNLCEHDLNQMRNNYCIDGICGVYQEIDFENKNFVFTGSSEKASRKELKELIETNKGNFKNSISKKTDYLIVGNKGNPCWAYSCYGRKIEEAMKLRKNGYPLKIINEIDFWDILEDKDAVGEAAPEV